MGIISEDEVPQQSDEIRTSKSSVRSGAIRSMMRVMDRPLECAGKTINIRVGLTPYEKKIFDNNGATRFFRRILVGYMIPECVTVDHYEQQAPKYASVLISDMANELYRELGSTKWLKNILLGKLEFAPAYMVRTLISESKGYEGCDMESAVAAVRDYVYRGTESMLFRVIATRYYHERAGEIVVKWLDMCDENPAIREFLFAIQEPPKGNTVSAHEYKTKIDFIRYCAKNNIEIPDITDTLPVFAYFKCREIGRLLDFYDRNPERYDHLQKRISEGLLRNGKYLGGECTSLREFCKEYAMLMAEDIPLAPGWVALELFARARCGMKGR